MRTLTVTVHGAGQVVSEPTGLTCPAPAVGSATRTCSASFPATAVVRLTAAPAAGFALSGWGSSCTTVICVVELRGANQSRDAYFRPSASLQLYPAGRGTVRVDSSPAGVDDRGETRENVCDASADLGCTFYFPPRSRVRVTARPDPGSSFVGWSEVGCAGTAPCEIGLEEGETSLVARFTPLRLRLVLGPSSAGRISSEPAGILCTAGQDATGCGASFAAGTQVTLTATPVSPATFVGWKAGCTPLAGDPRRCRLTVSDDPHWVGVALGVDGDVPVPVIPRVSFQVHREGEGTVTGEGFECGERCSERYLFGKEVTLTARAGAGARFVGWKGACAAEPQCTLNVGPITSITALFGPVEALSSRLVAVSVGGRGRGRRIRVTVEVNRSTGVVLSLRGPRSSRVLAARSSTLRPGANALVLVVPRRLRAGSYRLAIAIRGSRTFARNVRLGR